MKRNMRAWMYGIMNSPDRKALPVLSFPGAEINGASILQVVSDAHYQYECIKAISDKYSSIAVVTCMDLSVEAQAFGCEVHFTENEVPAVIKGVIKDIKEAEELEVPNVGAGRTLEYINAAEMAARNLKGKPVFAGMIGPFSLAGRLSDMSEAMMNIILEPDGMKLLLEKITLFLIEYAKAFKAAGANGIIIAEPAAGLLSPQHCHEFSSEYVKKIVEAVQDDFFMVILHNCGNTENQVESMVSTGAMGLHFGNAVDMARIMPQVPWGRVAMGNVDPARVIKNGTVADVKKKTEELLWKTAIYKNFVLSTGCDVPPGTPQSNIKAFFDELDSFNRNAALTGESA